MIIEIRNLFKAQGFKIVLIVMTVAMIVSVIPFWNKDGERAQAGLVSVNGSIIPLNMYQMRIHGLVERIRFLAQQWGMSPEMLLNNFNPETIAYQSVVEEKLLDEAAKEAHIPLSPGYLAMRLQDPQFIQSELGDVMPSYIYNQDGSVNPQLLQEFLQKNDITGPQFEAMIEQAVRRSLMRDVVSAAGFVSDADVRAYFSANNLAKSYEIARFKRSDYEAQEAKRAVSDKELKEYFDAENKRSKKYIIPEKRSGKAYIFSPDQYGIQVSDKELKQFYDLNKTKKYADQPAQIKLRTIVFNVDKNAPTEEVQAVEKKAQDVLVAVKAEPKKFAEFAKKHSQDARSAQGGLTEFLAKGSLEPSVDAAAFRLKENDDISELLVTSNGFEIIQRVDKKAPTYKSFESVKDAIKKILDRQKFSVAFGQDMGKLIHRPASEEFKAFIAQKHAQEQAIPFGLKGDSHFTQKLFKMKKGAWTYYFNDNMGIALKLDDIQKSSIPALSSVKEQVEKDLGASRVDKKLAADVKKAAEKAKHGDFAAISKEFGASYEKSSLIKPTDTKSLEHYQADGAPVDRLKGASMVGTLAHNIGEKDGFVVKVAAIEPFDNKLFESFQSEIKEKLGRQREKAVVQGFVASLYRTATIKPIDPNLNIK